MRTNLKWIVAWAAILGMIAGQKVLAGDSLQLADVEQAFSGVAAPELPVTAAGLVSQSKDSEKESVTILVVRIISEINPASIPSVIGAVGHSTPTMASVAAANAISLQPRQVDSITRAAVNAAPARAGEIVSAEIEQLPAQYAVIAAAAAGVAPSAGKDILAAVMTTVPSLKPYIEKASSTEIVSGTVPVVEILNQSAIMARRDQTAAMPVAFAVPAPAAAPVSAAPAAPSPASTPLSSGPLSPAPAAPRYILSASGPVIGPPPIPLTTTPVEIGPGQTVPQQPGGRNYSSP